MKPLDLARIQSADADGVFERFEIPALILRPVRQGLTGALKLVQGSAVRMIGYSGGGPTVAASSLAEERLGPLLQEREALSVEQLTRIDEVMRTEGLQFGAAAIKLGVLSKMDLARWLKEQHAHVVTQCLSASSVRATFGPLGKLTASRSGLQLLSAIEAGVRAYPLDLRDELQAQLEEIRFVLPAGAIELAHDLGCSESLGQLLKMQGADSRSFQEYLASSEDDDPVVPILTLILTGLALPEGLSTHAGATADEDVSFRPSPSSEPVVSFGAEPAARDELSELPPAPPPAAARPVASVDDLEALLKQRSRPTPAPAPKRKLDDVDNLLTSLSTPAPVTSHPAPDFGRAPAAPDRSLDSLFDSPAQPQQPQQPPMGGWGNSAVHAIPSSLGGMPMGGPGVHPGGAPMGGPGFYGTTPVPAAPTTGVPYQTGVPQAPVTGVPGAPGQMGVPYAVIPKELLAAVERAQRPRPRTGLFVIGVVALLLAGVGGAAVAMTVLKPGWTLPGIERGAVAAAPVTEVASAPKKPEPAPAAAEEPAKPAAEAQEETAPEPAAEAAPPEAPEPKAEKKRPTPTKTASASSPKREPSEAAPRPEPREAARPEPPKAEPKKPEGGGREEITTRLANARRLMQAGDHRGVIQVCTEVLGLEPRNAMAYRNLGISYSVLGAKAQACEAYRRYLRFAGNPPDRPQIESLLTACN